MEKPMIRIVVVAKKFAKSVIKDTIWMTITSVKNFLTIVNKLTNMEIANLVLKGIILKKRLINAKSYQTIVKRWINTINAKNATRDTTLMRRKPARNFHNIAKRHIQMDTVKSVLKVTIQVSMENVKNFLLIVNGAIYWINAQNAYQDIT